MQELSSSDMVQSKDLDGEQGAQHLRVLQAFCGAKAEVSRAARGQVCPIG